MSSPKIAMRRLRVKQVIKHFLPLIAKSKHEPPPSTIACNIVTYRAGAFGQLLTLFHVWGIATLLLFYLSN